MLGSHWGAICLLNPFGCKDCSIWDSDLGDITFFSLYGLCMQWALKFVDIFLKHCSHDLNILYSHLNLRACLVPLEKCNC